MLSGSSSTVSNKTYPLLDSQSENESEVKPKKENNRKLPESRLHENAGFGEEVREFALRKLAQDFLNVPDASLESRAYLMDSALPVLVIGLEKLIAEVERRCLDVEATDDKQRIPSGPDSEEGDGTADIQGNKSSRVPRSRSFAGCNFEPEPVGFNPINFLAQWLFRNNPRFSDLSVSSPYVKELTNVGHELKNKVFSLDENKRAQAKAEVLARLTEEERAAKALAQQLVEKQNAYEALMTALFKKWYNKLWRTGQGFLFAYELVHVLSAAVEADNVAGTPLVEMISHIRDKAIERLKLSEYGDQIRVTSESFNDALVPTMVSILSKDDVDNFVASLSKVIDLDGDSLKEEFENMFFTPVLSFEEERASDDLTIFKSQLRAAGEEFTRAAEADPVLDIQGIGNAVEEFCTVPDSTPPGMNINPRLVESEFKGFCKRLAGQYSIKALNSLLGFIVRKYGRPREIGEGMRPTYAPPAEPRPPQEVVPIVPTLTPEQLRSNALNELFDALRDDGADHILIWNYNRMVQTFLELADPTAEKTEPETLQQFFGSLTIRVDARQRFTKTISKQDFTQCLTDQLARVQWKEDDCSNCLKKLTLFCKEYKMNHQIDRATLEKQAINEIRGLLLKGVQTSTQFLESAGHTVNSFHRAFHSLETNVAIGRFEEMESMDENEIQDDSDEEEDPKSVKSVSVLRYVACTPALRRSTLGKSVYPSPEGVEFKHFFPESQGDDESGEVPNQGPLELSNVLLTGPTIASEAQAVAEDMSPLEGTTNVGETANLAGKVATDATRAHVLMTPLSRLDGALIGVLRVDILSQKDTAPSRSLKSGSILGQIPLQETFESDGFAPEDIQFNKTIADILVKGIEAIDLRNRLSIFAQASVLWYKDQADGVQDVEFFIIENGSRPQDMRVMLAADGNTDVAAPEDDDDDDDQVDGEQRAEDDNDEATATNAPTGNDVDIGDTPPANSQSVPTDASLSDPSRQDLSGTDATDAQMTGTTGEDEPSDSEKHLVEITRGELTRSYIFAAIDSESKSPKKIDDRFITPIFNEEGMLVAMMAVKYQEGHEPKSADDAKDGSAQTEQGSANSEELEMVSSVLSSGIAEIKLVGARGVFRKTKRRKQKALLATDKLDPDSQRELLFPRLMLMKVRQNVRLIDSAAIAELKSYKKPPATVWKVLKAVLYVFGVLPTQVDSWEKTVKFLSADLLRKICDYDPTAVQKKRPFLRIKKAMRDIPHGEVEKKGSSPAYRLYQWLTVSLYLRKKAVAVRKRAKQKNASLMEGRRY